MDNLDSDLHAEFRSLLKLTQLVTAINHSGHPTLRIPLQKIKYPLTPLHDVLLAIATLLVRKDEIVAVGASGTGVVVVQQPMVETTRSEPDSAETEQRDAWPLPLDDDPDVHNMTIDGIAAVSNSRLEDEAKYSFPAGYSCILVSKGKCLIEGSLEGVDMWEHFHAQKTSATLADHICTLEDYLILHQRAREAHLKKKLHIVLTKYLLVHCWEKMYARINDGSSQGCIYILGTIQLEALKAAVACGDKAIPKKYANRNNKELAALVISMVEKGQMASAVVESCLRIQQDWGPVMFTNLLPSLKRGGVYDETTCVEFHRLLLTTLLAYGYALNALNERQQGSEGIAQKYNQVFICASLLRQIVSSLMIRQHLWACRALLHLPTNNLAFLREYKDFTKFPSYGCLDYNSSDRDDEPEYFECEDMANIDEVFLVWACLQASHLLALGTLSRAFSSENSKVPAVTLLTVQGPSRTPRVELWTKTVDKLLNHPPGADRDPGVDIQPYPVDAVSVKEVILSHIPRGATSNRHSVFAHFRRVHNSQPPNFGDATFHCEVLMALLMKCPDKIPGIDPGLIGLLQNLNQNLIAVSEKCCPVCSEVLDIWHDPDHQFRVRGHHPTIYPVELPPWHPSDILLSLIARFRIYLLDEIKTMMLPKVYYRSPSQQSESAISNGGHDDDYVSKDDPLHEDSSALALARANQLRTVMLTEERVQAPPPSQLQ